ncbi:MAG: 50S ribosomal protein L32 [Bacteroidetes Order II. Incertae sedis bacterium]|nr:50S ribosomal protein L32 [Bacteroidetes Order II. bacterium]
MANPRRKHSKARTALRRSQYKAQNIPQLTTCSNCGEPKEYHRACSKCGHYRGRAVIEGQDAL